MIQSSLYPLFLQWCITPSGSAGCRSAARIMQQPPHALLALPAGSEVVESAAMEAASSSTRDSGWAPGGGASAWECQAAAQSRQARRIRSAGAELGCCLGALWTMLPCRRRR